MERWKGANVEVEKAERGVKRMTDQQVKVKEALLDPFDNAADEKVS